MKKKVSLIIVCLVLVYFGCLTVCVLSGCDRNAKAESENSETDYVAFEETAVPTSTASDAYTIDNFDCVLQMPELPTGCEITSLTMLLNYLGYDVDKLTMAREYLPTQPYDLYYDESGRLCGPDLNNYFIGDTESYYGYVCGTGAVTSAANSYFSDNNSSLSATDITGASPEELYKLVAEDKPVVVWITVDMAPHSDTEGWYTENGDYVEWSQSDHAGVLIGYASDSVTVADPLSGITEYDKSDFESVYASRGSHSVIIE